MKGGVKTGNLRNIRGNSSNCADRGDVVRLMQRRERHERFKRGEDRVVDQNRGRVMQPAVHHAVADTGKGGLTAGMRRKPAMNGGHRTFMIVSCNWLAGQPPALRIGNLDARRHSGFRSNAVDLPVGAG